MYIVRDIETKLLELLNYFPVVALLGPRQVGKTTLVKQIQTQLPKESLYLDLENPVDSGVLQHPVEYFRATKDKIVIIDEVQRAQELFPVLRSVIDSDRSNGRFILLGSASTELIHKSNETLAGRVVYLELTPFTLGEVSAITNFREHWLKGGFPTPFTMESDAMRIEWFKSFITTYIERDLRNLGLGTASKDVGRLLYMLASVNGGIVNYSSLANSIGLSSPLVKNVLSFFEHSFIIRLLQPWYSNVGKRLVKSPKIYFRDSGIVNYLHNISKYDELIRNPMLGNLWEGYVIENIINSLGTGYQYYFYRTADGTECDLVIFQNAKCYAIVEAKFSTRISKTKSITISIHDLKPNKTLFVIPDCLEPYKIADNMVVANLEQAIDNLKREK